MESDPLLARGPNGGVALIASPGMILHAQQAGAVTGRVTAASGIQPVASAEVFVSGTQLIAVTDADGSTGCLAYLPVSWKSGWSVWDIFPRAGWSTSLSGLR